MSDDTLCEHLLASITLEDVFMYDVVDINTGIDVIKWHLDTIEQMAIEINADDDPQLWLM